MSVEVGPGVVDFDPKLVDAVRTLCDPHPMGNVPPCVFGTMKAQMCDHGVPAHSTRKALPSRTDSRWTRGKLQQKQYK